MLLRILPFVLATACSSRAVEPPNNAAPSPTAQAPTGTAANELRWVFTLADGSPAAPAVPIVTARLEALDVRASVRADGGDLIVELPGHDAATLDRARHIIARRGYLEFRAAHAGTALMQRVAASAATDPAAAERGIDVALDRWMSPDGTYHEEPFLQAVDRTQDLPVAAAKERGCVQPPVIADRVTCLVSGREILTDYLSRSTAADGNAKQALEHVFAFERQPLEDGAPGTWRTYVVDPAPRMDGTAIVRAEARGDMVTLALTPTGRAAFATLTAELVGAKLAILLDDTIMSAPIVQEPIAGGRVMLSTGPAGDAADLAIILESGALPAALVWQVAENLTARPAPR